MIQQSKSILAVPNLQGERYPCGRDENHIDWVPSETSLKSQVESIANQYNGHEMLIGSSFGGLAAWSFAAEYRPVELKGVVLLDVLPTLDSFPKRKGILFSIVQRLPTRISQTIYNQYRYHQNQRPVPVKDALDKVLSLQQNFPRHAFPIPTLVLSTNVQFHHVWKKKSIDHELLTAQEQKTISVQIGKWLGTICQKSVAIKSIQNVGLTES